MHATLSHTTRSPLLWSISVGMRPFGFSASYAGVFMPFGPPPNSSSTVRYVSPSSLSTSATLNPFGPVVCEYNVNWGFAAVVKVAPRFD